MANLLQLAKNAARSQIDGPSAPTGGSPFGGQDKSSSIVNPMIRYLDELDDLINKDQENRAYYRVDMPTLTHVVKSKVNTMYKQAGQENMAMAFGTFADYMNDWLSPWAQQGMPLEKAAEFLFDMDAHPALHRGDELSHGMRTARDLMFTELGNRAREVESRNSLPRRWDQLFSSYQQASLEQDNELSKL